MQEKENARQAWKTERAYVREHDGIIARIQGEPLPVSDRDLWILGSVFTAISLGFVLMGIAL